MLMKTPRKKLKASLFFASFSILGGLWVIPTLLFSERFPHAAIFRRWELIPFLSCLLLAAGVILFLIRHTETTLHAAYAALQRVRLALKARSQCSQILVRASDELALMEDVCRIIVESEGYRLAWVGFAADDAEQSVQPVAQWGSENGYLKSLKVSWGENAHGRGPTGIAIRSGAPCVAQHILTDPKWVPWRERALHYGFAASISLPLADDGQVFGALVIFAGEADAFDAQEVELLQGLADDLAHGIATLRLRNEQEQGKQERMLLATIVEQEADGVLTFDTAGRVQYLNPAFEAISGYRHADLVGADIRALRDAPSASFLRLACESLAQGQPRSGRFIERRRDGTSYDVEARVFPVCGRGGIASYAAVIRDLTHEVHLERQLRQAQKMEAIATLAGGIAHDFNNILAAIALNAELALDQVPEDALVAEHLGIVLKAGARARNLVKQIMTLSCQAEQERLPVRLDQVVGECMKLLRPSLPATIETRLHSGAGSGLVLADPGQIHQVIMNLCTNAADAMRERGGSLDIGLHEVELRSGDPAASSPASGRGLRLPDRGRHRPGDGARDHGADLRSLLHHQGTGTRHRPRAVGGPRHRHQPRRRHRLHQRTRQGDHLPGLPAAHRPAGSDRAAGPGHPPRRQGADPASRRRGGSGPGRAADAREARLRGGGRDRQPRGAGGLPRPARGLRPGDHRPDHAAPDRGEPRPGDAAPARRHPDHPLHRDGGRRRRDGNRTGRPRRRHPRGGEKAGGADRTGQGRPSRPGTNPLKGKGRTMASILIIDDDGLMVSTLELMTRRLGHTVASSGSLREGTGMALAGDFDVVFLDVRMPDGNGLEALPTIAEAASAPEVIIVTGFGAPDGAELAIRSGAWDYLEKSSTVREMDLSLQRALQYRREKRARSLKQSVVALKREDIFGNSPKLRACLNLVAQAADSEANILITGETGTGKELFARAIHRNSPRAEQSFVVVDCAALPETLAESLLFGHEKGTFTGAEKPREGLIRQAHGGTLFLDEVGELPLTLQKTFLRVLQERRFRPLGSAREIVSDFRLVAATNRNLDAMAAAHQFRSDLLFRLRSFTIDLPPLRERTEDIKEIARTQLDRLCEGYALPSKGFSPEFCEALMAYSWPGNVRELANTLVRAFAAARFEPTVYPKHLPPDIRVQLMRNLIAPPAPAPDAPAGAAPRHLPRFHQYREAVCAQAERHYLLDLMALAEENIAEACRLSGLSQSRLYALLKKHRIDRHEEPHAPAGGRQPATGAAPEEPSPRPCT